MNTEVIATYSLGLCGYEIYSISDESVEYKFRYREEPEKQLYKHKIYYNHSGEPYFNTNTGRVYLKDCMRV